MSYSNSNIGKKIESLAELDELRHARKSIIVPESSALGKRPTAAAFAMNYTGDILIRLFRKGMYEYKPTPKAPKASKKWGSKGTNNQQHEEHV